MTGSRCKKSKSTILLQFIKQNPGLNVREISERLGWTQRSVRLVLSRLEKSGQISTRFFPTVLGVGEEFWDIEKEVSNEKGRLERIVSKLRERDRETFEKCVKAKMAKDDKLASLYAGQCAEIRRLIRVIVASEGVLNRVGLALESLRLSLGRKVV
ncbi:MAG: winged helix-turn-helix transcriptional regulator [Candidatus Bathyarchaeia archaeon]